ncbi:MAG: hypothetical protein E7442_06140 [Ruminococcaceae bacterium]|nr:hypothetical protein [Oscillospiraceae bacterium]
MSFLVLGVILCGLFFWGQIHKSCRILWPAVAISFLAGGILCVVFRPTMTEFDTASVIGAWFVLGTTFYALWRRFSKQKKNNKRL